MVALIIEDSLFLVKRSHTMPTHPGQVALLGGHKKPNETDPAQTAQREFSEETGFRPNQLELICPLPTVFTSRGVGILPMLGSFTGTKNEFIKDLVSNGEWDLGFLVKFSALFSHQHWSSANRIGVTEKADLLFRPLFLPEIEMLKGQTQAPLLLWGATARVVFQMSELILTKS